MEVKGVESGCLAATDAAVGQMRTSYFRLAALMLDPDGSWLGADRGGPEGFLPPALGYLAVLSDLDSRHDAAVHDAHLHQQSPPFPIRGPARIRAWERGS